ncbi:hypothetical protein HJFPF1_02482 [Paramyrothecium foliicola]|nr:hypothetical protein HJFPF1_02482 [Paramyrothecium foliicola]
MTSTAGLGINLHAFPVVPLPPDEELKLDDSVSLSPTIFAVSILLTVWASIFVAASLWVNRRKFDVGDCISLMASIWHIGFTGLVFSRTPGLTTLLMIATDISLFTEHKFYRRTWSIPAC